MEDSTMVKGITITGKLFRRIGEFFEPFATEFSEQCITKSCFVDIIIHILIMSMFIMSLYYFYTVWMVSNGIRDLINLMVFELNITLPSFTPWCDGLFSQKRYDETLKNCTDEGNKMPYQYQPNVIVMSITYLIWFFLLIFTIIFVYDYDIQTKNLLISNFVLFVFLGGIEYAFIYSVLQYVPIEMTVITDTFYDSMIKDLYNPPY